MTTLPTETQPPGEREITFPRLIGVSISAKLVVDTAVQIFYPFLAIIAAGLGTDVVTMGRLVSLRSAMGLVAPAFGAEADRRGFRRIMRLGLLLCAAGLLGVAASRGVWMAAPAMIVMGLGISAFTPTLQAYVSGRLPYSQRARGLGMVEYSWALTGIVGLSLAGYLIAATNWRAPLLLLAGGMVVMYFVFGQMPAAHRRPPAPEEGAPATPWLQRERDFFRLGDNARSTYFTILAGALSYFAASQMFIIYGAWLGDAFGFDAAALGTTALVLGFFDLAASVGVSLFTDRFGKRRSVILGIVVALAAYLVLPTVAVTATLAVLAVAVARLGFEFSIVAYFPLLSEQTPAQRGKVMTMGAAGNQLLNTLAGFTAPWLYTYFGMARLTQLSALAASAALLVALFLVQERGE